MTFITPAMVVERHTAQGRTRDRPYAGATSCHYTGSVRGQPASSVALSACNGLVSNTHFLLVPIQSTSVYISRAYCSKLAVLRSQYTAFFLPVIHNILTASFRIKPDTHDMLLFCIEHVELWLKYRLV